ncbi:hypothetical protein D3C85_1283990 [compost metagenome]
MIHLALPKDQGCDLFARCDRSWNVPYDRVGASLAVSHLWAAPARLSSSCFLAAHAASLPHTLPRIASSGRRTLHPLFEVTADSTILSSAALAGRLHHIGSRNSIRVFNDRLQMEV